MKVIMVDGEELELETQDGSTYRLELSGNVLTMYKDGGARPMTARAVKSDIGYGQFCYSLEVT